MPYRILHSIASVNPKGGGPIEGLKQLAASARESGHSVEIVSLDDPESAWVAECPLKCHALGPAAGGVYQYSARLVPWLQEHCREYDCVVIEGLWQYSSLGVWRAFRKSAIPYFVFTHGMLDPWFKQRYPRKHLKKCLYWFWGERRVLKDARAVLFTCEEERRLARQSFWPYRCNELVVGYGTAGPSGDAETQRKLFAERFPETVAKRNLLFLGRVHEKKGADLLFRGFARLLAKTDPARSADWQIVMAGPSDHLYGAAMKELVAELGLESRVTWTGMVTGDLKWGAFYNADAFVLSSHQENFGIAVVEALACGVPVLISNKVNIWREIEQDQAGLVDEDTVEGTARLLDRWFELEAGPKREMRLNATNTFLRRFHISTASASFIGALGQSGVRDSTHSLPPAKLDPRSVGAPDVGG